MFLPGIYLQPRLHVGLPQIVSVEHPQDGLSQYFCGFSFDHFSCGALLESSGVAGVPAVDFVGPFFAGELDLKGEKEGATRDVTIDTAC